ncbi:MAG TPA: Ig-like domain-containing protein, partial [Pirellulales bacterium]|nr:Ig-like domain-containing protein [Pirellulales bacterium]
MLARHRQGIVAFALLAAVLAAPARADESLVLLPAEIKLSGSEAVQKLLVEQVRDGHFVGQLTADLVFESSNPEVVAVEEGEARPKANGQATITVKAGGRMAAAVVTVDGLEKPFRWSFRNHVESVLAKSGCSSGACHGAQAGKNGFKLSLRGYDPLGDFFTITRQARGRRIVPSDPGRSLVLTKPSGGVPHKGGLRFRPGSRDYRVIADWIAAGTPAPQEGDPRLARLEILPAATVLKPPMTQQLVVLAHFSDGHTEDVTRWVKYTSTNESVAQVDEQGLVAVTGYGEGAITGWYLSRVVIATVSSPFPGSEPAEVFARAERRNFIDELVLAKLASLNIPPSPQSDDGEFLRR